MHDSMRERLLRLDTCAVCDALDTLGLPGAVTGLRPLWPADWSAERVMVGTARTIRVAPRADGLPAQHIATPVVESAAEHDVVVIDNRGRTDVSCWGGILTVAALRRGVAGVVVDGAARDVGESQQLGLPVFGRAAVPVSARGRIVQEAMDVPVSVGGVVVRPADLVVADCNGVVFVPAAHAERVVTLAERIAARERDMVAAVRAGRPVTDVMHDSKFPSLEDEPDG